MRRKRSQKDLVDRLFQSADRVYQVVDGMLTTLQGPVGVLVLLRLLYDRLASIPPGRDYDRGADLLHTLARTTCMQARTDRAVAAGRKKTARKKVR